MKIAIAYESKYGNGKKCMEFLKDTLAKGGHAVDLFSVREKNPNETGAADLYVFSAPVHAGNVAGKMKKYVKKAVFPKEGAKYALVATSGSGKCEKCFATLEGLLDPKGLQKAVDGLSILVTGMKGPCEDGHETKLAAFAKEITKK
jgi:multimeric flavodoxin WrbA